MPHPDHGATTSTPRGERVIGRRGRRAWLQATGLGTLGVLSSVHLTDRPGNTLKSLSGAYAPPPEGSRFVQVREHELVGLRVTEVVLGKAELDDRLPMLVHFHGRGDQPHLPQGDHGGTPQTRLIFPWAPDRLGDGYTWYPLSVTDRSRDEKVLGHYIREQSDVVDKMLRELVSRRPTLGRPVVTGFSQGAMMTLALALRHAPRIGGAVPVAGWMPNFLVDENVQQGKVYPPIHAMHGRGDPIVKASPAVALIARLRELGLDATMEVFEANDHAMNKDMHARHREIVIELLADQRRALV
ncbi:MAG: dienelactone hydrolase family protein [Myxococcota bacterium]